MKKRISKYGKQTLCGALFPKGDSRRLDVTAVISKEGKPLRLRLGVIGEDGHLLNSTLINSFNLDNVLQNNTFTLGSIYSTNTLASFTLRSNDDQLFISIFVDDNNNIRTRHVLKDSDHNNPELRYKTKERVAYWCVVESTLFNNVVEALDYERLMLKINNESVRLPIYTTRQGMITGFGYVSETELMTIEGVINPRSNMKSVLESLITEKEIFSSIKLEHRVTPYFGAPIVNRFVVSGNYKEVYHFLVEADSRHEDLF